MTCRPLPGHPPMRATSPCPCPQLPHGHHAPLVLSTTSGHHSLAAGVSLTSLDDLVVDMSGASGPTPQRMADLARWCRQPLPLNELTFLDTGSGEEEPPGQLARHHHGAAALAGHVCQVQTGSACWQVSHHLAG